MVDGRDMFACDPLFQRLELLRRSALSAQCADKKGHPDAEGNQEKRELGSHVNMVEEVVSDEGAGRTDSCTVCSAIVCFSVAQSAACV